MELKEGSFFGQERITANVANVFTKKLDSYGVIVVVEAEHIMKQTLFY
ncbi:MAG: hypothetical protein EWM50_08100 [Gottschalkiaceae bacterium]|nr:MAG: hypothetical protein EWM50_08100 [Gottschalkiaceae bacterium]